MGNADSRIIYRVEKGVHQGQVVRQTPRGFEPRPTVKETHILTTGPYLVQDQICMVWIVSP